MKQIAIKFFGLLIITVFSSTVIGSDQEASARIMQNQAITAERQGRNEEAVQIYEKLVEKYPETQSAVEANKVLLEIAKVNNIDKVHINDLMATFDVLRSETGRYPTTEEGFDALLHAPFGMHNWQGPYLSNPNYLKFVKGRFIYKLGENGPVITPK